MNWDYYLAMKLGNNTLYDYLLAIFIILSVVAGLLIIFFITRKIIQTIERKYGKNTLAGKLFNMISWPLFLGIGLKLTSYAVEHSDKAIKIIDYVWALLIIIYSAKIISQIILFISAKYAERKKRNDPTYESSVHEIYARLIIIAVWLVSFIFSLSLFELNIYTLLTSLGLFTVAIGFAMQNVISDLFATVSIYFDKPFAKGDFIIVGADMGTVEKIGIKSTRIKTLQGEQLIMSNRELTETRVRNFRVMERRRVLFNVGVTYDTSLEKLKEIPKIIEKILIKLEMAEFSRAHFKEFADSSLVFEGVYFIKSKEYEVYMDTHQQFNLELVKEFRKKGIVFAFPTRTIWMNQEPKKKNKK